MLAPGSKMLVSHRRLFAEDEQRFFIGELTESEGGIVKLRGYSFVRDLLGGGVIRKDDRRTKIIALATGALLFYELPQEVDVDALRFTVTDGALVLTDGGQFLMNMAESPHGGRI